MDWIWARERERERGGRREREREKTKRESVCLQVQAEVSRMAQRVLVNLLERPAGPRGSVEALREAGDQGVGWDEVVLSVPTGAPWIPAQPQEEPFPP